MTGWTIFNFCASNRLLFVASLVKNCFPRPGNFYFVYIHINQVSAQLKTTASGLLYDSLIKIKISNESSVLAEVMFTATPRHL